MIQNLEVIVNSALTTWLWSEIIDAEGEPFDTTYDVGDIAKSEWDQWRGDIQAFLNEAILDVRGMDLEQIGHDFTLTRNGHGAGFWDRGLGERGDRLTAACKLVGTRNAYLGDDNLIYGG